MARSAAFHVADFNRVTCLQEFAEFRLGSGRGGLTRFCAGAGRFHHNLVVDHEIHAGVADFHGDRVSGHRGQGASDLLAILAMGQRHESDDDEEGDEGNNDPQRSHICLLGWMTPGAE